MTPATRISAAQLGQIAAGLGDRERLVLGTLSRVRLATTRQLERLHFTDATPLSNARSCRRTLARLMTTDLVARLERRVGGVRAGSAGYVWSLGAVGQRLVSGSGPAGGDQPRRPWTPSPAFTDHRLAITTLYVELVEASRQSHGVLESFTAEPDCWRQYSAPHGGVATLKPDAAVTVGHEEFEDAWLVEVDCATESPAVIRRKMAVYVEYYRTRQEQARSGVFPLVVFSVPTEARRRVIARVTEVLDVAERPLFQVALADQTCSLLMGGAV